MQAAFPLPLANRSAKPVDGAPHGPLPRIGEHKTEVDRCFLFPSHNSGSGSWTD